MKLRYISLHMDFDSGYDNTFRNEFNADTRFINHYLSTYIRGLKFNTDNTFDMISVVPSLNIKHICRVVGDSALQARINFKIDAYQKNSTNRYEYYLKLLEEGYRICAAKKEIPCDYLLRVHQEFREKGYKNEWLYKKKRFKEHNIEVLLNCFFTSSDFKLVLTLTDIKMKKEIISGIVIRTEPNEIYFDSLFKDVIIEEGILIITERAGRPKFKFKLSDLLNRDFKFEIQKEGLSYTPLEI